MKRSGYVNASLLVTLFAFGVILLGAFVRLSDAGLGCPDWPGCYGQMGAPDSTHEIQAARENYPQRPVDSAKAWKEMVHRYFAGTLGLLILGLALGALWRRRSDPNQLLTVPLLLVGLVIFQALLGMWTVTLLVKPAIVTAHLLGGMATVALLWWLTLRQGNWWSGNHSPALRRMKPWAWLGLGLLLAQITLGGWTSTNYAALACPDFPICHRGSWWPQADFGEAFVIWRGLGVDYEFGVLDGPARTAIHLAHRLGAVCVFLYLLWLGIHLLRGAWPAVGGVLLAALVLQIGLGVTNVLSQLPLPVAVAHNGGAALLLLILLTLLHGAHPRTLKEA